MNKLLPDSAIVNKNFHWEKWIVNGNEKYVTGYNLGLLTKGQRSRLLKP